MKANVDKETCIGCELCATICPSVFEMDKDGKAYVIVPFISEEEETGMLEAEESCPVEAISHE